MTKSAFMEHHHGVRIGLYGAVCGALGIITSGPLSLVIVSAVQPQPSWVDAETFADQYNPIQALPFLCGLVLVAGLVALVGSIHSLWGREFRARSSCASFARRCSPASLGSITSHS